MELVAIALIFNVIYHFFIYVMKFYTESAYSSQTNSSLCSLQIIHVYYKLGGSITQYVEAADFPIVVFFNVFMSQIFIDRPQFFILFLNLAGFHVWFLN